MITENLIVEREREAYALRRCALELKALADRLVGEMRANKIVEVALREAVRLDRDGVVMAQLSEEMRGEFKDVQRVYAGSSDFEDRR